MTWHIKNIRNISLKWKLLIPFLFLPAALTVLLVLWGVRAQNEILTHQEEALLRQNYEHFQQRVKLRLDASLALASIVASDPYTAQAIAARDRGALIQRYFPIYQQIRNLFGLKQFHFHEYPGRSLLRLHLLDTFGDLLTPERQTIDRAYETGTPVGGLEYGLTGFGIRGVAPVYLNGRIVGSVEIGSSIERPFLRQLTRDFNSIFTIYTPAPGGPLGFRALATTAPLRVYLAAPAYRQAMDHGSITFQTMVKDRAHLAVLTGPIRDFQGKIVAVVEIVLDRADTLAQIRKYRLLIIVFGLSMLLLAMIFVWWVSTLFLAPVDALTNQARKIAAGQQVPQMEVTAQDEFGALAEALNKMLAALELSRQRLANHAQELEVRVAERTAALVRSEEKFRTLVENIPIVVYRLEPGMIRSFVSPHIERLLGVPPEEAVGPETVWAAMIHPDDRDAVVAEKARCLEQGQICQIEYRLVDRAGQDVPVLDHAEPAWTESGRVAHMEGYMLDLRERKRLEEQTFQAEELKTLGEISARLAHEFRNPLSAVGVCARRLGKTLAEDDPGRAYVDIMTQEVARLETILRMILTYIQPLSLSPEETDPGVFLGKIIREIDPLMRKKSIQFQFNMAPDLPPVHIDRTKMSKALINLIRNAAYHLPVRGNLSLSAFPVDNRLEIKLVYGAGYLTDDRLRHYFYPFTTEEADQSLVDLPLVPVVIQRHNGVINVERLGEDMVAVTIDLPFAGSPSRS